MYFDKIRITAKVIISDARKDSHTPFIPRILESMIAQIPIAIAPRSREPMIAGRGFAVAEKYPLQIIEKIASAFYIE